MNGHVEVVKFLIKNDADINACPSSCLIAAVLGEHTDVVHVLVSAGQLELTLT